MRSLNIIFALFLAACGSKPHETVTTISDPNLTHVDLMLEYIQTAAESGAVAVQINGHTWRYKDPFHHGVSLVRADAPFVAATFAKSTKPGDIEKFLNAHKADWIRIKPGTKTPLEQIWTVLDYSNTYKILYVLESVTAANDLELDAIRTHSK